MNVSLLLPKILNTCIVLTSVSFYASRQNTLISVWVGVLWASVLLAFSCLFELASYQTMIQTVIAFVLLLLATKTGFHMVRQSIHPMSFDIEQGKKKSLSRINLSLIGLSGLYLYKQGIDSIREKHPITLASLSACLLFSLAFYAAMKHATVWIQQCVYSTVIFFTAAIQASKLIGYFELMYKGDSPLLFSLVYTLRQQEDKTSSLRITSLLFEATLGLDRHHPTTAWQNTGYSLYWILLIPLLIYSGCHYQKGAIKKIK